MKYESGAAEVYHRRTANRSVSFKRNVSKHAFSVSSLGATTLESDHLCVYENSAMLLNVTLDVSYLSAVRSDGT